MPTVLHIDGNGWPGSFEIKQGESLADTLNAWGVTWTARDVERIPTARKLSREAAEFIASYQRKDPRLRTRPLLAPPLPRSLRSTGQWKPPTSAGAP